MATETSRREPAAHSRPAGPAAVLDAGTADRVRRAGTGGRPLPLRLRAWLEPRLGAGLGTVRVHTGPEAAQLASRLGVPAFTAGAHIFLASGRWDPDGAPGMHLIAHEAVHVLQQRAAPRAPGGPDLVQHSWSLQETQAAAYAAALLRGDPVPPLPAPRPGGGQGPAAPVLIQCHGSWEHRLLGDFPASSLKALAAGETDAMKKAGMPMVAFQQEWIREPQNVDEARVRKHFPEMRTLRLKESGLLVTYGELNALPDYLANPISIDEQPAEVMLPVLQQIRQEFHNRLLGYLEGRNTAYPGVGYPRAYQAPGWTRWSAPAQDFFDTNGIDGVTRGVGPKRTNRYTALLARQACHFAPYSWYRWEQYHLVARSLAEHAYNTPKGTSKDQLTRDAWMYHGYADHFLQDSFASGHLVDKTRIMQWYARWLNQGLRWLGTPTFAFWKLLVSDVSRLPVQRNQLYTRSDPGTARDPQTAEEQATRYSRMALSGIDPDGAQAAGRYNLHMRFMNFTAAQLAIARVHNHFNEKSLWVASEDHKDPFQIWGDYTMLQKDGVMGVGILADTCALSQQSIRDILATGSSSVTAEKIIKRFPTMVQVKGSSGQNELVPLRDWHDDTKPNLLKTTVQQEVFTGIEFLGRDYLPLVADLTQGMNLTPDLSVDHHD